MICPRCGSTNTIILQQENRRGYGFCKGILGYLCLGVPGLLCGLLGMGKTESHQAYIACGTCHARTRL